MPVVTVDLGVNRLAVMGAFRNEKLTATKFIHGGKVHHHRHQLLNVIANKRRQSGRLQANVQDNVDLWQKVRNMDENTARQVARQIVNFALDHAAKVIVLEYLRRYRPPKERMSRSGRKNHKRAYWLRGKIMRPFSSPSTHLREKKVSPTTADHHILRCYRATVDTTFA